MSGNIQNRPRVDLTPAAERHLARYPGQIPAVVVERALDRLVDTPDRAALMDRLTLIVDRVERGVALPEEVAQLRPGLRVLAGVGSYRAVAGTRSGPEKGAVRL